VALTMSTLLTVMPGFEAATVEPEKKLDPEMVIPTLLPWTPEEGESPLITGTAAVTVKLAGAEVPMALVTVMLEAPGETLPPIAKEAVI
jgi:hypothetical protein